MGDLKYSWLSKVDPAWAPIEQDCKDRFSVFWGLPPDSLQEIWKSNPLVMPEGTPMDLDITYQKIPMRDGHQAEIKVYKNSKLLESMGEKGLKAPLMLTAHGGGWIMGDHTVEEGVNRHTAKETGAVVVSVDYRLSPKHRYPQHIHDYYDAFKWCQNNASSLGIDPSMIITCGSSAGGNLAAVLPIMAQDLGDSGIIGQLLNSPVLCHPNFFPKDKGYEYNSFEQNADSAVLGKENMMGCWLQYFPDPKPDVYANPLLVESVKNLPATLLQIAGQDPLRDEQFAYADKLKEGGIPVDVELFPGLPHGFYTFPHLAATTKYFKQSAAWVKKLLASNGWDSK